MDTNRLLLWSKTMRSYHNKGYPAEVEFLIITRSQEVQDYVQGSYHKEYCRVIRYELVGSDFSQAVALNIGIKNAKYENIIVTSPEVKPLTNVLHQLSLLPRSNYICQVFDEDEQGNTAFSLVNKNFRGETPAMHFLGCFKNEDLEYINGWSLDYIRGGGAYDDDDFGDRFMKAGLKFEVRDEIQAIHQYHPRNGVTQEWLDNMHLFVKQKASSIWYATRGLKET